MRLAMGSLVADVLLWRHAANGQPTAAEDEGVDLWSATLRNLDPERDRAPLPV